MSITNSTHIINDISFYIFFFSTRSIDWTDYVDLVIFEWNVAFVYINYVICIVNSKPEIKMEMCEKKYFSLNLRLKYERSSLNEGLCITIRTQKQ